MQLLDALLKYPNINIFSISIFDEDNQGESIVEPISEAVLFESESSDFFIIKAKYIHPDGIVEDCYIDMNLPERIGDYVYFYRDNNLKVQYSHEVAGDVISAVPIDCCGNYELFYSKIKPEIGIEILRRGIVAEPKNSFIAEDLGYILRDEGRYVEAGAMFQISVDLEPSAYFIYGELADCYEKQGDLEKAEIYRKLFDDENI